MSWRNLTTWPQHLMSRLPPLRRHKKQLPLVTFELAPVANEQAYKALCSLGNSNAMGADGIPVKAFKIASGYIAPSITYLCKESFLLQCFPHPGRLCVLHRYSRVEMGLIVTIIDPFLYYHAFQNLWSCVNSHVREIANQASLVSGNQFAYKKSSSCNVALIRLVDEWKWAIHNKRLWLSSQICARRYMSSTTKLQYLSWRWVTKQGQCIAGSIINLKAICGGI